MTAIATSGTAVVIKVGTDTIAYGKTSSFKIGMSPIDISNKDSAGYKEIIGGQMSWSMDGDFVFYNGASYGFDSLFTALEARSLVTVSFTDGVTGHTKYTGSAMITSLERSAPNEGEQTFKASFEGSAGLTQATI
jgi:predicted secreted protein